MRDLLGKLKYKKIEDFPEQEQKRLFNCLNIDKLYAAIFSPEIYVKVYEQFVETRSSNDNSVLWSIRITLGSYVLLDKETGTTTDFFVVPLRPFRIRSKEEVYELNRLLEFADTDFSQIKKKQDELLEAKNKKRKNKRKKVIYEA